ncbi:MAG TPA: hypothetical protein VGP36_12940 [Mycobacteriales bacterium]|jgi:hypothetical protein|nr:hypothetical protein [Mycobacteriales bacterium]
MSSVVLTSNRPCGRGIIAGVLYSAVVSLGFSSLVGEWSGLTGRPALIALDIAVGGLGLAALVLVRRAPVRLALVLSALLAVSVSLTPVAGAAMLWVGRRRRLPVAIAVAATGVAGHLVRELWRPEPGRPLVLWLIVIAASYAALTLWGAQHQARSRPRQCSAAAGVAFQAVHSGR